MRQIKPELVKWLDKKLELNGLAQTAIKNKNARLLFSCAAESCVGIHEQGGNNMGQMVELFQSTIGTAVGEPWCMAFMQSCIAYAEVKTGVISGVFPSEHVLTTWEKTHRDFRVKVSPLKGAIVIWQHGSSSSGHTGMVIEANLQKNFNSIEGNTGSDGGRDGDGVYLKHRDWIRNGDLNRIGFLKPF